MAFGRAGLLVALLSPPRPATQPLQKEELSCGLTAAVPCMAPEQNGFLVNSGTRKIEKRPRSPDGPKLREKERANVRRSPAYADNKSISMDQIRVVSDRCCWSPGIVAACIAMVQMCSQIWSRGFLHRCGHVEKIWFRLCAKSGTALHPERNNAVPTALGRLLISSPSRWVWARQYRLG